MPVIGISVTISALVFLFRLRLGRLGTSATFGVLGLALLLAALTSVEPWKPSVDDMSYSHWVRDARRNPCGGREAMVLLSVMFIVSGGCLWLLPARRKEQSAKQQDDSSSGMDV